MSAIFLDCREFRRLGPTQIFVAAQDRKLDRVGREQAQRNDDRPHGHVNAQDQRTSDVFMTRARIDVEQGLPHSR